ncbi:MAG: hypothetical protein RLZZ511_3761 [Cyanobacteriota bacterium]|jgi:hypothetical protein
MTQLKLSGDLAIQDLVLGDRGLAPGFTAPDTIDLPANSSNSSTSPPVISIVNATSSWPISATIRQTGGNLERAKVLFYLSPDAVLNRSDRLLSATSIGLEANAATVLQPLTQTITHEVSLPSAADAFWQSFERNDGAIAGYIGVVVEGLYGTGEKLTDNNRTWAKFSLAPSPLQIYDFTYHYNRVPPTLPTLANPILPNPILPNPIPPNPIPPNPILPNPTLANPTPIGDFYRGMVIAPAGHYQVGQWLDWQTDPNQAGHNGQYEITGVQSYEGFQPAGRVDVVDYFDAESSGWYRPPAAVGTNYLGSESGYLSLPTSGNDRFGGDFYEADVHWTAPIAPTIAVAPRSSDPTVQALINHESRYWDARANGGIITYSFYRAGLPYGGSERVSPVNEGVKRNVRQILADLEQIIPIDFVEVDETTSPPGVLRYLESDGEGRPFYAYTYYPNNGLGSDVHLSNMTGDAGFDAPIGSYGYRSLLHETLHALGLKHPGQYDAGAGVAEPPYLHGSADHSMNTVMSYNLPGSQAVTAMPYDIAALQYLYGQPRTGADTTYAFTQLTHYQVGTKSFGDPRLNSKLTIADAGGTDTLDFSGLPIMREHRFDLRPGGILTTQAAYETQAYRDFVSLQPFTTSAFGVRLGQTTEIENLVNSIGHDSIIANDAANQFLGYRLGRRSGNDTLAETRANDRLVLQDYQLADLQVVASDAELLIRLAGDGTVKISRYFDSPMVIQINDFDYRYDRQTLTWMPAAMPAISEPTIINANSYATS